MHEDSLALACEPASSREEAIASGILHLKRNVALYPFEHAAVRRALENVRAELKACFEETGKPFSLPTHEAPSASEEPPRRGPSDASLLRRLLRRHLVSEATLLPDVTDEELCQFCSLFREERFRRDAAEELPFDPSRWQNIVLEFYRPGALEEEVAGDALLRAVVGPRLDDSFRPWLEKLPGELRERAQEILHTPEILGELSMVRAAIRKVAAGDPQGESRDLVREIVATAASHPERPEDVDSALRSLVGTLRSFVEFLRANAEILAGGGKAIQGGRLDLRALLEKFAERDPSAGPLLSEAERLKLERRRLAALFRSSAGESEARGQPPPPSLRAGEPEPTREPRAEAKPATETPREAPQGPDPAAALVESGFRGVEYDLGSLRERLRRSGSVSETVTVALELLRDPARRDSVRKNWPAVLRALESGLGRSGDWEALVGRVLDFAARGGAEREAEELLVAAVGSLPSLEDAARAVEGMVLPRGGHEAAKKVLRGVVSRNRQKGVRVLAALAKGGGAASGAATAVLLDLASDPGFLADWALEDPACVAKPAVSSVLEKTPGDRLREAFRRLFVMLPAERAETLLGSLPPGVEAAEEVIFAALSSASPGVRRAAIRQVPRFPSARFVGLLKVLLDRNNKGPLCLPEVEAALDALRAIRDPSARRVLEEIDGTRRLFRYAYRKEIRDALRGVRRERG